MSDDRLPTKLWLDARLKTMSLQGTPYYIIQEGAYGSGTVMLKINGFGNGCKLLQQQRNFDGDLGWMMLFKGEIVAENEVDSYIDRSIQRDPDMWVIEIEDKDFNNPFEGKIF